MMKSVEKVQAGSNVTQKGYSIPHNNLVLTQSSKSYLEHSYSIKSGCIRPNEPSPDYLWKFDGVICDFLQEQEVPGATLYMTYNGKPVYQQGYGINECGLPMSSSSCLRIASISKVFTAIAILRLCDENRLNLDNFVFGKKGILKRIKPCEYIRSRQAYRTITVRHLLEHSAGWDRDSQGDQVFWYADDEHAANIDVNDNEQLVCYVLTKELSFTPGKKHAYSNLGYLILGLIVEEITGMSYEDFVSSLLRELDIEDVHVGKASQDKVHYMEAKYYNNSDPTLKKSIYEPQMFVASQYGSFPMETSAAYGGWVTCAKNLVVILDNLCNGSGEHCILSQQSIREMFKTPKFAEGDAWYGLGIDIDDNGAGFGHTGAMEGTSTTVHHSGNGYTWALLLNAWAKDTDLDGLIKYALCSVQFTDIVCIDDVKHLNHEVCNDLMELEDKIDCEPELVPPSSDSVQKIDECSEISPKSDEMVHPSTAKTHHKEINEYFFISEDRFECVQIFLPHCRFLTHVTFMKNLGYKIHQVNALSLSHDVLFNLVWRKNEDNPHDWTVIFDVGLELFSVYSSKKGYKVVNVQSYFIENKIMHLLVFEKCLDLTHEQKLDFYMHENEKKLSVLHTIPGYRLKLQCILWQPSETCISVVLEKNSNNNTSEKIDIQVWSYLSLEDFVPELAKKVREGMHLQDFLVYSTNDVPHVSAVWKKSRETKYLENNVYQRHDVSKYGFMFEMRESLADNLPVKFVSAYMKEGVINFATLWDIEPRNSRVNNSLVPDAQHVYTGVSGFQRSLFGVFESFTQSHSNQELQNNLKNKRGKSMNSKPKGFKHKPKTGSRKKRKSKSVLKKGLSEPNNYTDT